MATSSGSTRDVRLKLDVDVDGEAGITSLANAVRNLAKEGDPAAAGFNKLADELDRTVIATEAARKAETAQRAEVKAAAAAVAEKRDVLSRLRIDSDAATRGTEAFQSAERSAKTAVLDASVALRSKRAALSEASDAAKQAAAAEQQLNAQARTTIETFKAQATASKAAGDSLASSVDGIAAGFGRLGAAAAAAFTGREFIDTINQAEGLRRGLEAVSGGSAAAGEQLAYLKRTANELGLDVQSAGQSFLQLTAATQGTTLEGAATQQVFEAVSRAMAALGKSSVETERALLAVGQIASKGTVQMEELRGQLGEALPGALRAAAAGAGVTTQQLIAMVDTGNVLAKDLLPALTRGLNDIYATGGPPDSLNANWNRLKNVITETAVALGEGGATKGLTKAAGAAGVALLASGEALVNVGADLGEFAGAVATGNLELSTQAERLAESERKIKSLAQTAGLTSPEIAKIGTAADDAGLKARDALRKFDQAAETSATLAETLGRKTIDLAQSFEALRAKGDSTAEAIAKIGKDFDLSTSPGIQQAEDVLNRLLITGRITAREFNSAFSDALKGIDLNDFELRARVAFAGTVGEARKLKEVLDAIGEQALARVGSSVQELQTGISKATATALADVDELDRTLVRLGVSGSDAGRLLGKALDSALASANTERAVQAVIERVKALGDQGLLTGDQLAAGLQKAKDKIDDLKPGVDSLNEALKNFGFQTREQLQATADKLGASYQRIANSTSVSLADQRRAFDAYAAAAIAANNGVESGAVAVARAMLEIREAAAGAGNSIETGMQRGGRAVDDLTVKVNRLGERLNQTAGSLSSVTKSAESSSILGTNTYDKQGFATDSNGQRIVSSTQANVPEGSSFDQQKFQRDADIAARTGFKPPDPNDPRYLTNTTPAYTVPPYVPPTSASGGGSAPAAAPAQQFTASYTINGVRYTAAGSTQAAADAAAADAVARAAQTPTAKPTPVAPPAQITTVVINVPGLAATQLNVATRTDADMLAAFLGQLEVAQRASQ